ncbi:hypothetical protein D3C83_203920 [compost metagenome]
MVVSSLIPFFSPDRQCVPAKAGIQSGAYPGPGLRRGALAPAGSYSYGVKEIDADRY